MIKENKFTKYFLYAFGEILLIIVGVLIALSAAEWNSNRKNVLNETKALREIYKGLEIDQAALELAINNTETGIKRISMLDSLLKENLPIYTSSLDTLFGAVYGFRFFSFEKTNYEYLKSNSLNLIKSDSLRQQLILVFETAYSNNEKNYNTEVWVNDVLRPYYLENFHSLVFTKSATPNNYESLWRDAYYKNIINYRLVFLKNVIMNSQLLLKQEIQKLMRLIKDYIKV
jgi:hypothetical protein